MSGLHGRRVVPALAALVLLTVATACSGGSGHGPSTGAPSGGTGPQPRSAPMRVEVTHVAGSLSPERRRAVETGVRRALTSYLDRAFLRRDYPHADFDHSFGAFTTGTARDARHDADLLTNRELGSTTTSVRATHRTAYLSVLGPQQKAAGATAAVDLTFAVDRGDDVAQRVHLKGRLLLTRDGSGRWAIFGYDLNRSQTASRRTAQ